MKSKDSVAADGLCPLCGAGVENQRHVFMECAHPGMVAVRKRAWGCLAAFLADVAAGGTVTALEEAQIAARGDPKKERKRLERQEERLKLQGLKDMEAYGRLSKVGYAIRVDAMKARKDAESRPRRRLQSPWLV